MATLPTKALTQEIGVAGYTSYSGQIYSTALRELNGSRGRQLLHEMRDTDPTAGAMITAMELLCRGPDWHAEPADDSIEASEESEFVDGALGTGGKSGDMSHSFSDFLTEALTMCTFGFAVVEPVYKRRIGPDQSDPARRSDFTDGRIGIRKMVGRAQTTIDRWMLDETGGIQGAVQRAPETGREIQLPIERMLLFRTTREGGNPEGRSVLRSAYLSWRARRHVEQSEFVGIERELTGVPVVRIPNSLMTSVNPADVAIRQTYEKIARDLKFNEQGGLTIPSDPWMDANGSPSSMRMVEVDLIASAGTRSIDTSGTINRLDGQMARSILADFLMLGANREGSFALSKDKSDLFLMAITWFLSVIKDTLNRHLLPRIWSLNGLDRRIMPKMEHGSVAPVDLEKLGAYIRSLAGAGVVVGGDENTDNHLRRVADLPEVAEEAFAESETEDDALDGLEEIGKRGAAKPAAPAGRRAGPGGHSGRFTESDHPRVPAGHGDGGQFTSGHGGAALKPGQIERLNSDWKTKLTTGEQEAVQGYTRNEHRVINRKLREGDDKHRGSDDLFGITSEHAIFGNVDKRIAALDAAVAKYELPGAVKVYRGMAGVTLPSFKPGDVIEDAGFVSSSVAKVQATKFAKKSKFAKQKYVFEIDVPGRTKALFVDPLSHVKGEKELLLERGLSFRVAAVGKPDKDGIVTIQAVAERTVAKAALRRKPAVEISDEALAELVDVARFGWLESEIKIRRA